MKVDKILGMLAIDKNGIEIGKISNLDIETETGEVITVTITKRENPIKSTNLLILFSEIKTIGDYIIVDKDVNDIPLEKIIEEEISE